MPPKKLLLCVLLAGCNGGPDLCTRSVDVGHKLFQEIATCVPDAGLPPDTEIDSEIAKCKQQINGCDAQDQTILSNWANCLDQLPAIQCGWFTPSDAGPSFQLIAWGFEALACQPTQKLSATCDVPTGLPLDGGISF